MILNDFLMLAAVTSRTNCYLDKLIAENLLPSYVLILNESHMPGQDLKVNLKSLQAKLKGHHIPYEVFVDAKGNEPEVIERIGHLPQHYVIYSGYGGVILKKDFFQLNKEILHVHGGKLPQYRGSTTVFYQMLAEDHCTATALFLREKIDAGPILHEQHFPFPRSADDIDHGYEPKFRAQVLTETIQSFLEKGYFNQRTQMDTGAEDYYVIHPVLKHLAILNVTGE